MERLSYSHIELLIEIQNETKRLFYEVECIRGNWSVQELKRQITSLYFERSGLSYDKKKLEKFDNSRSIKHAPVSEPLKVQTIGGMRMLIEIPPKYAVSAVVGYIKGKSAIAGFREIHGEKDIGYWIWQEKLLLAVF
ncbi:hypothetical protein FACS189491_08960 [Spirochaetia bacterium]|nr:hypothetical protein FACS189491_08960 [Spirochaetia bacterium]